MRYDFHYIRTTGQFERDLNQAKQEGNNQALENAYQKLIQLLQHTGSMYSHGLDHKRIHGIHRVRLNGTWRAWFFPVTTDEGKQIWVLARLVKHEKSGHDYQRIAEQVERFQLKHQITIAEDVYDEQAADVGSIAELITRANSQVQHLSATSALNAAPAGGGGGTKYSLPAETTIYDRQCIIAAKEQAQCIDALMQGIHAAGESAPFIGVAVGAPGAGKTLILDNIAKQLDEPVLYIAESGRLRRAMAKQWRESPLCADGNEDHLRAQNYLGLLKASGIIDDNTAIATDDDVYRFFEGNLHSDYTVFAKQFLRECEIMAVCASEEEYLALGHGHSMFKGNIALQSEMWRLHTQLMQDWAQSNMFHPSLSPVDVTEAHRQAIPKILLIDEALDYSRQQLLTLLNLGVKIIIVGDGNQDLYRSSATTKWLRAEIARRQATPSRIIKLNASYRSSLNAIRVANKLLFIKKCVTPHGDKLVDTEIFSGTNRVGKVEVLNQSLVKQLNQSCRADKTAVLFNPEDILSRLPEAKRRVIANLPEDRRLQAIRDIVQNESGFDLCYTIDEFKGFGADNVVLYGMISDQLAIQFNAIVTTGKKMRDDISTDDWQLAEEINKLFTAVTRSKCDVYIVRTESNHKATPFYDWLSSDLEPVVKNELHGEKGEEDWYAAVLNHLQSDSAIMVSRAFDLAKKHSVTIIDCIRYLHEQGEEMQLVYDVASARRVSIPWLKSNTVPEVKAAAGDASPAGVTAQSNQCVVKAGAKAQQPTMPAKHNLSQTYSIEFNLPPLKAGSKKLKGKALKEFNRRKALGGKITIDFSKGVSFDTLNTLILLSDAEFAKIQPHHIYQMMSAPVAGTAHNVQLAKVRNAASEVLARLQPNQIPKNGFSNICSDKNAIFTGLLMNAVDASNYGMIQTLLRLGAHPDSSTRAHTPLQRALYTKDSEAAKLLLANNPPPNILLFNNDPVFNKAPIDLIAVDYTDTLLPYIVNHPETYRIPIDQPIYNILFFSLFHISIFYYSIESLKACLARNVNQSTLDPLGMTALHSAVLRGFTQAIDVLDYHEIAVELTTEQLSAAILNAMNNRYQHLHAEVEEKINAYLTDHPGRDNHSFTALQLAELVSFNDVDKTMRAKANAAQHSVDSTSDVQSVAEATPANDTQRSLVIDFALPPIKQGRKKLRGKALKQHEQWLKSGGIESVDFSKMLPIETLKLIAGLPDEEIAKISSDHMAAVLGKDISRLHTKDNNLAYFNAANMLLTRLQTSQIPISVFKTDAAKRRIAHHLLSAAVRYKDRDTVRLLLGFGADTNVATYTEWPLMSALLNKDIEIAELLLTSESIPDVFVPYDDSQPHLTLLIDIILRHTNTLLPILLRRLEKYKLDLDAPLQTDDQLSIFHLCIVSYSNENVRLCIENSANQRLLGKKYGLTALHYAVLARNIDAINLLDMHEISVSLTEEQLIGAMDAGLVQKKSRQQVDAAEKLRTYFASKPDTEVHTFTPLELAALLGYDDVYDLLLTKSAGHQTQLQYAQSLAAARARGLMAAPSSDAGAGEHQAVQQLPHPAVMTI